ncbi:MAG: hypothetical protein LIR50_04735 [Bacillota bacterium]|nr:hypothetical protein [Bacillota bacterium]
MGLLKELSNASGVSGRETNVRDMIIEELKKNNIEFQQDNMGNVLVKKGNGNKKLMISAHMDEAGFITTFVDKGFLRVSNIGDIKVDSLDGELVKINGLTGKIVNKKGENDINSVFIDMMTDEKLDINEGDTAVFRSEFSEEASYISGKALVSRALCYMLLDVIKKSEPKDFTVYFVFTVQSQLKGRGARAAAYTVNPDLALILEGENSNDYPGGEGNILLNHGPVLRIMDKVLITHHQVIEIVVKAAEMAKVSLQKTVSDDSSEGGELHKEVSGIKTGVLALPIRYKNSSLEIAGKRDLEDMKKVLLNIIE